MELVALGVVRVQVVDIVAVGRKHDVAPVGAPRGRQVHVPVRGDATDVAHLSVVDVDVSVAALAPAGERDLGAVRGKARGVDLRDAIEWGDLGDVAGAELDEAEPRLGDVVAAEHRRPAVGRDVGLAGSNTEGQPLVPAGVAAVPAVQVAPAVAEVVHAAHAEHHVAGGPDERSLARILDFDHLADVDVGALAPDPDAFADASAGGGDPLEPLVAVTVRLVEPDVRVVPRPERIARRLTGVRQPSPLPETATADPPGLRQEPPRRVLLELVPQRVEVLADDRLDRAVDPVGHDPRRIVMRQVAELVLPVARRDVVHEVHAVQVDRRTVREDARARGDLIDRLEAALEHRHPDQRVELRGAPAALRRVSRLVHRGDAFDDPAGCTTLGVVSLPSTPKPKIALIARYTP